MTKGQAKKLQVGDRLKMTSHAVAMKLDEPSGVRRGMFCGISRQSEAIIRVRRDTFKRPEQYAISFWREDSE